MSRVDRGSAPGALIDRDSPLRFTFNDRTYTGYRGDTLASALLANGISLTGRSFKYHRPRGIQGAGYEEPATLVQLSGGEDATNWPVTRVPLSAGLAASSVNCWPSPDFDVGAVAQAFSRLLPAGFYYKTFMWPNWHLFEPAIRRAAGLGHAPTFEPEHLRYETRFHHCDVLVIGAGPAGLMAALAAGRSGARVLLVDDDTTIGGRLHADGDLVDGRPASDWLKDVAADLEATGTVRRLSDATAWAHHEHNFVMVTQRSPCPAHVFQRTWRVRARQVVIATGAIERPMVFANNDRPGIMLASAACCYVNRYAVRPGKSTVVFTNNDSAWHAAFDLHAAGIAVRGLVDVRPQIPASLLKRASSAGIVAHTGAVVQEALGGRHLRAVRIASRGDGRKTTIDCDLLCTSGGWNPTVHLYSQSRGRLRYDPNLAAFVPGEARQGTIPAGSANGAFGLGGCLAEGRDAGHAAAERCGFAPAAMDLPVVSDPPYRIEAYWGVESFGSAKKAFVDIQNDVTVSDLELAVREGFGAVEHAKRYTTAGMGVDQGKTGNVNAIGLLAALNGDDPGAVGTTTFRPPYVPVEFGAVAGHRPGSLLLPYRHTPMTRWHKERGAVMYEAGARWRRPGFYPRAGETMEQAVTREAAAVRNGLGIYDGSPLGKFDIRGPDAVKLLDFVYTNDWDDLGPDRGRYGIMLSDDGLILDDGVTFKLADDHYLMTTSTANADMVYRMLEGLLQTDRPDWRVAVTPVTEHWANATVCGPKAREFMRTVGTDIDLDGDDFPFMSMRVGRVANLPARMFRVSYTGELSFEINVPAGRGLQLWESLIEAGRAFSITPIGSEANHLLRVEKGFLSPGHEVDGTADPYDLGLGWIVSGKKPDFIGKRALEIRRASGGPRRELVGLLTADPHEIVPEGSPITPGGRKEASEGFVSACVMSVARGRSVALALLRDGRARIGQTVSIRVKKDLVRAAVTKPVFYDPTGERLRS